jgi:anti-sigma B factor antagonist
MLGHVATSNRSQSKRASQFAFGVVQRELDERTSVISVEGDLDLSTSPQLKRMLLDSLQSGYTSLILDLSLTSFMDSTALGVLVGVNRQLDLQRQLAIVCASAPVLRIFEFSGLDGAFAIFPTLDEALAHTRGHAARAN